MSITIPPSLVGSTTAVASDQLSQLSGVIALIVGVLLAMLAIDFLIGAFHKK